MDYKGGNGYIISPCSSVNSRSVLASNAIGNQCKNKKPLSAAKVCIPQILPSKFKPKLLPPGGDSEDSRTRVVRHPKAHSCEDIYTGTCDCSGAGRRENGQHLESSCSSECVDGLRNASSTVRRGASEFSSLYRTMHHIQRPSSVGCSPHGSVRSLASLFEKSKADEGERSEGGCIPREAVSSRVSEFEMIIQMYGSQAPVRSSSMPTLNSSRSPEHNPGHVFMATAVSAESLLVTDTTQNDNTPLKEPEVQPITVQAESPISEMTEEEAVSPRENSPSVRTECPNAADPEVEQILNKSSTETTQDETNASKSLFLTPHNHHQQHLLHHLNHQHLKPSKCKGSCPASYTRFTTILRHERQQAQQERPPAPVEKKTTLPSNLFLMTPAPFRLRKNTSHQSRRTLLATKVTTVGLSPELRPLIPQRLSSLEVLGRLGNGDNTVNGLDANGNLLAGLDRGVCSSLSPLFPT